VVKLIMPASMSLAMEMVAGDARLKVAVLGAERLTLLLQRVAAPDQLKSGAAVLQLLLLAPVQTKSAAAHGCNPRASETASKRA
jgi:hypothetical protein